MKTISKNILLFALLVCCNRTIKSAAAADEKIDPAVLTLGANNSFEIFNDPSYLHFTKMLYLKKVTPHLKDEALSFSMKTPKEQEEHVKSLTKHQQRELLDSLERPYNENNQFFQGLRNLLPKAPDQYTLSYVDLPDETKQKIFEPLNIVALYRLLTKALTPPGEVYKK